MELSIVVYGQMTWVIQKMSSLSGCQNQAFSVRETLKAAVSNIQNFRISSKNMVVDKSSTIIILTTPPHAHHPAV